MNMTPQQIAFVKAQQDEAGDIDPKKLLETAQDPTCVIHDLWNWNVDEAAYTTWFETACRVIRFVKLEVRIYRKTIVAPFYVGDPDRETRHRTFTALNVVAKDTERSEKVLLIELARIAGQVRRLEKIAAVCDFTEAVAHLRTCVEETVEKVEARSRSKRGGKRGGRGAHPAGLSV